MEDFLLVIILIVLAVRWFVMSGRIEELEHRLALAEAALNRMGLERARPTPPPLPQVAMEEPAPSAPPKLRVEEPVRAAPPRAITPSGPLLEPPPIPKVSKPFETARPVLEPPTLQPAGPTLLDRLRARMKGEEWEAIVGGNWLNKLGVFVLVIGIALFLGYSFNQFGPAGRAIISLAVSAAMLGGGFLLDRRAGYRIFSYGLLGGGWAALYITTYAMQALDATKVIYNPVLGALLLLAVAVGMIGHSLKYRSQTVTGLAYFIAFVTLAITPVTALSVLALVPLAASLLYVAYRFEWSEMAVFGLVATYGTCASRGDSGAPLWSAQIVFSTYWLLFEAFDLLRTARKSDHASERWIMPLNALAFVGLSYAKWSASAPHMIHALAAGIAGAYFLNTIIRTKLRPPSSFAPEIDTVSRALAGGYEGPITLTAILTAAAVFLKFHGGWANAGLLAEAELLFLAGLFFRESYPRQLAAALFATGTAKLLIVDLVDSGQTTLAGWSVRAWTPSAALSAVLFYINRALRRTDQLYGYAASGVVALIIGLETPERFLGVAWFVFATILFMWGWSRRLLDFRLQAYLVGALALTATGVHQAIVASGQSPVTPYLWMALLSAAVLMYAAVLCALRSAENRFDHEERESLKLIASWISTAALMALVWRVTPGDYLGLGWMLLSLPILELGLRKLPAEFRIQAYLVAAVGAGRVLLFNVLPVRNDAPMAARLVIAGAAAAAYAIATRVYGSRRTEDSAIVETSSATGTAFLLVALWALLPSVAVGPAWAAVALLLLELGLLTDLPGLRVQSHLASGAALGRLFFANFDVSGVAAGISTRLLSVVPVIACHYYLWSRLRGSLTRLREWERGIERLYLYSVALLITVLLRFELGRDATVAGWSVFALALIAAGRRWDIVDLRWQSYAIAALTSWRSWTTDFWSPLAIASFFAAQFLVPRAPKEQTGIERHARLYFSLLATSLLTILLYHQVSGRLLTMAWAAEGLVLLAIGFPVRDRILRLSGLTLFLVCILKLFLYDLRQLETLYRILSFIVLGLILVTVSWVYTRFRDRVHRYL